MLVHIKLKSSTLKLHAFVSNFINIVFYFYRNVLCFKPFWVNKYNLRKRNYFGQPSRMRRVPLYLRANNQYKEAKKREKVTSPVLLGAN